MTFPNFMRIAYKQKVTHYFRLGSSLYEGYKVSFLLKVWEVFFSNCVVILEAAVWGAFELYYIILIGVTINFVHPISINEGRLNDSICICSCIVQIAYNTLNISLLSTQYNNKALWSFLHFASCIKCASQGLHHFSTYWLWCHNIIRDGYTFVIVRAV